MFSLTPLSNAANGNFLNKMEHFTFLVHENTIFVIDFFIKIMQVIQFEKYKWQIPDKTMSNSFENPSEARLT